MATLDDEEVHEMKAKRWFADFPSWIDKRLEQASEQELESWAERVLDAKRLEDVFSPA